MYAWTALHAHAHLPMLTQFPDDEECLIKTPDSSKPFAVTFHWSMGREKALFSLKNTANLWWALRVEANAVPCCSLSSTGIGKSYILTLQLLSSSSHCWFSYLLMHNSSSSKQNTDDYQGHKRDVVHHLVQTNWTVSCDETRRGHAHTLHSSLIGKDLFLSPSLCISYFCVWRCNFWGFLMNALPWNSLWLILKLGKKNKKHNCMSNSNPNDHPRTFNFMG